MKYPSPRFLIAAATLVAASSAHAAVIYSDDFSGDTVGATPAGWTKTGSASNRFTTENGTTASGTAITILGGQAPGSGNYAYWDTNNTPTNFVVTSTTLGANSQLAVAIGETLTYSFSWVGANNVTGSSAGGFPTGTSGFGAPMVFGIYGATGGYQVQVGLGSGNTVGSIQVGTVNSTGGAFASLNSTGNGSGSGLVAGTLYSMNLSLTQVDATTMSITYGVIGGSINFTSNAVTTITGASDFSSGATLQIGVGNTRPAFGFDDVNLSVTAVPEPSTYGLIGAGALAAVAMVRRRRKQAGKAA